SAAVALISIGAVERRRSIIAAGALVGALGLSSMVGWPYTPLANAGLLPDSLGFGTEGLFFVAAGIGLLITATASYFRNRRSV
ncbi:MAG TPA: hypothetical protein VHU91_05055, partial [Mycobacteriales bacterium]|nr:hypothetical protein [Mycobacteriales bacterium]